MCFNLTTAAATARTFPPRQRQVLVCIADGLLNKEIAGRLKLSECTVSSYRRLVYAKLGVSSRVEATRVAMKAGLCK